MENAYDVKDLGARLKAKSLIETEDEALAVYQEVKAWFAESAALSATPFDNLVVPFLSSLDALVLPQIDKIDGQIG